jgi:O-antigen/teichoic acid export membrane protein
MSVARRIAWNAITKWGDAILAAGAQFVLVKFLIEHLGQEGYGLSVSLYWVVSLSVIVQLGLRHALGRHLAEEVAKKNISDFNGLFSTALVCYTLIALALGLAFNLLAEPIVNYFGVPPESHDAAVALVRYYVSLHAVLSLLEPAFAAVLFANHRFDLMNYGDITDTVVRATLVVLLVGPLNLGIVGWALGMLGGAGAATLLKVYYAFRTWPLLQISPRLFRWQHFRDLYALGWFVFLRENVTLLGLRTDPAILIGYLGIGAMTFYQPGLLVVNGVAPFVAGLVRQFTPMAAAMFVQGKEQQVQDLLIRGSRFAYMMGGPICIVVACFAHAFVEYVWLGPGFSVAAWVLIIWTIRTLASFAGSSQWPVAMGLKQVKFIVNFQLALAVINVLTSWATVAWMVRAGYGMTSVVGVVIPTAVLGQIERVVVSIHLARMVGITPARYFREAYLRPNLVLVIVAAISLGILFAAQPQSVLSVLSCMAAALACSLPLSWGIGLTAQDRKQVLKLRIKKKKIPGAEAVPTDSADAIAQEEIEA